MLTNYIFALGIISNSPITPIRGHWRLNPIRLHQTIALTLIPGGHDTIEPRNRQTKKPVGKKDDKLQLGYVGMGIDFFSDGMMGIQNSGNLFPLSIYSSLLEVCFQYLLLDEALKSQTFAPFLQRPSFEPSAMFSNL